MTAWNLDFGNLTDAVCLHGGWTGPVDLAKFPQRSMYSFYRGRSRMRKKRKSSWQCHLVLLGPTSVKAAHKTLAKLTPDSEDLWLQHQGHPDPRRSHQGCRTRASQVQIPHLLHRQQTEHLSGCLRASVKKEKKFQPLLKCLVLCFYVDSFVMCAVGTVLVIRRNSLTGLHVRLITSMLQ